MLTWDIPINIKVSANTESEAERIVTNHMDKLIEGPALTRQIEDWDFIEFVEGEDESPSI